MKTFLMLLISIPTYAQNLDDGFIDRMYEYAMGAEARIDDLENKNASLHCEIHEYVVLENRMREMIDSLYVEVEHQKMLRNETFSIFTSMFVLFLIIIITLIIKLVTRKNGDT
jgi:hypothetical protein